MEICVFDETKAEGCTYTGQYNMFIMRACNPSASKKTRCNPSLLTPDCENN